MSGIVDWYNDLMQNKIGNNKKSIKNCLKYF